MEPRTIRIGGACGYWGEWDGATAQLLRVNDLDYLVYDYLAEITMSVLARARAKDPQSGFASDFVNLVLRPHLQEIAKRNVRLISNAGGVNPIACGRAVRQLVSELQLDLKVAIVSGDDLLHKTASLAKSNPEGLDGETFPPAQAVTSINAYLGAFPIAEALDQGADIVITGRCVDSALALGACIHEFRWRPDDWDRLAAGSLAGHLIECGPQATGGNFTDWDTVADELANIGYPVIAIDENGVIELSKPEDTGGVVNRGTVAEQLLYEIGDPQAYVLPDVTCDFSEVKVTEIDDERVRIEGARGRPCTATYKTSLTYHDGFRGGTLVSFRGEASDRKAAAFARAALRRAQQALRETHSSPFSETSVEVLAGGPGSVAAVVKIAAKHQEAAGIAVLLRNITGMGLATPPGMSMFAGSRPAHSPVVRHFAFLIPKQDVPILIDTDGTTKECVVVIGCDVQASISRPPAPIRPGSSSDVLHVPLWKLAWGRSGDKGDVCNIGITARQPDFLPYLWAHLTESEVARQFAEFLNGPVERFLLPGSHAINFVLHNALGGGGIASLRNDPQGKAFAQILLSASIPLPLALARNIA